MTLFADLFFFWVLFQCALGGWATAQILLSQIGIPAWAALVVVCALVLYRSDYHTDVPLFIAAYALGYWGEWWGTTRGVWTYWNHASPPDYMPPLWAIGLLTVTHLRILLTQIGASRLRVRGQTEFRRKAEAASFVILPALAFSYSAPRLAAVDWSGKLDVQFFAGIGVGLALLLYHIDIEETFGFFVCGMLLGGIYEWLGTWMREWTYITREVPPVWIIPLWGLACAAMVKFSRLLIYAKQKLTYRTCEETAKIDRRGTWSP